MKTTDDVRKSLASSKSLNDFLKENEDAFISKTLAERLEDLLEAKGLKKAQVIADSGIDKVYAYQILNGTKRHPDRDKLIMLCFGFHLSKDEANRLLMFAGHGQLYEKERRDSIIAFCLMNKYSLMQADEYLSDAGLPPLQKEPK